MLACATVKRKANALRRGSLSMYVDVALIIITMVVMVYKGILHIVLTKFFSLAVSPQLIRKSV